MASRVAPPQETQAKTEICQAIADRKIAIRVMMQKAAPDVGAQILRGGNVEVPPRLDPADLDWDKSRPFQPWNTGPDDSDPAQRYLASWPWKPRSIEWIELSTADVVEVLCGGGASTNSDLLAQTLPADVERRPEFGREKGAISHQDTKSVEVDRPGAGTTDVSTPRKSRRGPAPNTVDRYGESDRKLFDELERKVRDERKSLTAAANELAEAGRVEGAGAPQSRGRRLVKRYKAERERGN